MYAQVSAAKSEISFVVTPKIKINSKKLVKMYQAAEISTQVHFVNKRASMSTKGQQGHGILLTIIKSGLHFVQNDVNIDVVLVQTLEMGIKRCPEYLLAEGYLGVVLLSDEASCSIIFVYERLVCLHLQVGLLASSASLNYCRTITGHTKNFSALLLFMRYLF